MCCKERLAAWTENERAKVTRVKVWFDSRYGNGVPQGSREGRLSLAQGQAKAESLEEWEYPSPGRTAQAR